MLDCHCTYRVKTERKEGFIWGPFPLCVKGILFLEPYKAGHYLLLAFTISH